MVIFRENTEDIYAGIEYRGGTPEAQKILGSIAKEFPKDFARFASAPPMRRTSGRRRSKAWAGPSAMSACRSASASSRSATSALSAWCTARDLVRGEAQPQVGDAGAQGQHHEVHRGRLPRLGLSGRQGEMFGAVEIDGGPWCKIPEGKPGAGLIIKDAIADITLQQVLTRPEDFDVIATLNLNGDYLSDALAAQVGGIGIAPAATSTTSAVTPSSRRRTAPRPSTPTLTRSTPARWCCRA